MKPTHNEGNIIIHISEKLDVNAYSLLHLISDSVQCLIHAMTMKLRLTSKFSSEENKNIMLQNFYANL